MKELIDALRKNNVILFVGAGISMNLGLPSWNNLINHIAEDLGYDSDVFKTYGDNLSLAEFYEIKKGTIGSLRSWMDQHWHDNKVKINESVIHKLILDLDFPIIYTTNYDRWIEWTYDFYNKSYRKIINVNDLVDLSPTLTQIIKFHGDFDDDSSIVLTEASYFKRLAFESSLDIKLRSDILGKSILFLGYSLSDINMRYLIYKLDELWKSNNIIARPESFIFLTRPNPVQEAILLKRGIKTINSDNSNPAEATKEFLEQLLSSVTIDS